MKLNISVNSDNEQKARQLRKMKIFSTVVNQFLEQIDEDDITGNRIETQLNISLIFNREDVPRVRSKPKKKKSTSNDENKEIKQEEKQILKEVETKESKKVEGLGMFSMDI